MRVCLITPEFPTEEYKSGGISQATYRKARWMAGQGHDIHVIVKSGRAGKLRKEGIRVHPVDVKGSLCLKIFQLLTFHVLNGALYWLFFSIKSWLTIRGLNKNDNFDVVESPNYRFCGLFAMKRRNQLALNHRL